MSIGYACITIGVLHAGLARCTLKNASGENLRAITSTNLLALEAMIDYNIKNEIRLFRISSDLIPFGSHPINQINWWEEYEGQFRRIGDKIDQCGMRVTMHPGQYTVLNSPHEAIVKKAMEDLMYHVRILDALGTDRSSKLVLHIGGIYGDKQIAMERFIDNYKKLPQSIQDRLILENDDTNYTIQDVLEISRTIGAPVVFDNLHNMINPSREPNTEEEWILECSKTWCRQDGKPKLHYSQQKINASAGSHSNTIQLDEFLNFYNRLPDLELDLMLEVKDKNLSAVKCNNGIKDISAQLLDEEWNRYQYYVKSKSEEYYLQLKAFMQNKKSKIAKEFYHIVEKTQELLEDREAQIKTAQLIWNEISHSGTVLEKRRLDKLLDSYQNGTGSITPIKNHLLKCARIRNLENLMNSLYFYLN